MPPRDAYFARTEAVPLAEAAGRVAARAFGAYPPGVPLAVPGELLAPELIDWFADETAHGAGVFGLDSLGRIPVVQ